ncbi:MAG: hypothetical protein II912_04370 [Clostridia bacterium]|nr:hypothetical protein [Clostridia bacterium]
MTPAERVRAVYHWQTPDYVPFTIYETKVKGRPYEQELMDLDICCIRRIESFRIVQGGDVTVQTEEKGLPGGRRSVHKTVHTPFGDLTKTEEYDAITAWTREYSFKDESDYAKLFYLYDHQSAVPCYDKLLADRQEDEKNGAVLVRTHLPHEPVSDLLGYIMGPENYCYEWMDHREEVTELIERMRRVYRQTYLITANDPFEIVNQGGNPTPEIIGRDGYRSFYMREYADAYEVIHPAGKLLGTHLDACNGPIMDLIAEARLDYIEAYDPVMSPGVAEATRVFGDKLLSLHFPSAWQTHDEKQIARDTIGLIEAAKDPRRLIIGITEDAPMDRYVPIVRGIMTGIREYGRLR